VAALQRIVSEEAVMRMDDLLFRRTDYAVAERDLGALRQRVALADPVLGRWGQAGGV
jgi:glycerol-3-phosphate dehydrogenase